MHLFGGPALPRGRARLDSLTLIAIDAGARDRSRRCLDESFNSTLYAEFKQCSGRQVIDPPILIDMFPALGLPAIASKVHHLRACGDRSLSPLISDISTEECEPRSSPNGQQPRPTPIRWVDVVRHAIEPKYLSALIKKWRHHVDADEPSAARDSDSTFR